MGRGGRRRVKDKLMELHEAINKIKEERVKLYINKQIQGKIKNE